MEIITIFQDYKQSISEHKEHFSNILSFKEILGDQNCILEVNGSIRISNYIGTFTKGNTCLEVLPKIYSNKYHESEKSESKESLALVYRLLHWSGYIKIKSLSAARSIDTYDNLLDAIIGVFVNHFLDLHQKDVYREYVTYQEEQTIVKGKILFAQSFKKQVTKSIEKYVEFDELSINNTINRIVKTILKLLLHKTTNHENRKNIRLALLYLEDVDVITLYSELFNSINYNRINESYKPLIELAQILSNNQQPSLHAGKTNTISFTLQMNLLYEYFMKRVFVDVFHPEGYEVKYQREAYLATNTKGNHCIKLKPDFLILKGKDNHLIIDTKFRNPVNQNDEIQVPSNELYQMCTYALRFQVKQVILLYPLFKDQKICRQQTYNIKQKNVQFSITAVQVNIMENDYEAIVKEVHSLLLSK